MMGAKQGVVDAFIHKFGAEITDPILCTPEGDLKDIDEFSIHELIQAVKDATDRPQASAILEEIREATRFAFNFRQKVITNVEQLNRRVKDLAAHGTPLTPAQIVLIVMANIEHAEKHPYGRDFRPALQKIRASYPCSYDHDEDSLKAVLAELATADAVRSLREAPAPEQAHEKQANEISFVGYEDEESDDDDSTYHESAYAASSSDESTIKSRRSRSTKRRTKGDDKSRSQKGKDKDKQKKTGKKSSDNECPHCRKLGKRGHPNVPKEKCYWNKSYKGWRPDSICKELEVEFKPKKYFTPENGGWPVSTDNE